MFEIFGWLFKNLVYTPQLNLLQIYYNLTHDIGFGIILVAITVNLILWPVIVKSYLSGMKMRLIGPQTKSIQAKYKTEKSDEPAVAMAKIQSMRGELKELYKKHNISTGVMFQVVFLQLFFASGVFYLVRDLSENKVLEGIYPFLSSNSQVTFPKIAFEFTNFTNLDITKSSSQYIILPLASLVLSYLYGMYSFKWAPNAKLPVLGKVEKKEVKKDDETPTIDTEAIMKQQEFMVIYILPFFSFALNFSWSAGLNLYFATLSLFNLVRQIVITQYYANHINQLIKDIKDSDPELKDVNLEDLKLETAGIGSNVG